jgi:tetratricopeptide (TPR) repeat protein
MIDFFLHSEKKIYNRLLWDSISALSPASSLEENQKSVVESSFEWVDRESLIADFIAYVDSIKTFPDLVAEGIKSYAEGDLDSAEASFQNAAVLRADHYVPLYYLGLIYYNRGEYSMAEYYYLQAVKNDGHEDLLYYALGVNAYADSRMEDSSFYLKQAVDAAGSYSKMASELMEEISASSAETGGAM